VVGSQNGDKKRHKCRTTNRFIKKGALVSMKRPLFTATEGNPTPFAAVNTLAAELGADEVVVLHAARTHMVYRLHGRNGSYILKWYLSPAQSLESTIYHLLRQYGVPTLPVYAHTGRALVLEDLHTSPDWRLAEPADMEREATGAALAAWYRRLHQAGRGALADSRWSRYKVKPWVKEISAVSLAAAGAKFKLEQEPAWAAALRHAPALKAKYLALPQTFNYNDFAAENLALSRDQGQPLRAIVFDYDCFTTGVVSSDWRNVMFSLQGAAKVSFQQKYGPISEAERLLDEPLAILFGLVIASQRDRLPCWAEPLAETVFNGELGGMIREAVT
jgi:hypothetical protein